MYDKDIDNLELHQDCQSVVFITETSNILNLAQSTIKIFNSYPANTNINLYFSDIYAFTNDSLIAYINQLKKISEYIVSQWTEENIVNLNVLTHLFFNRSSSSCGAGVDLIAIDGEGIVYMCPAFCFDKTLKCDGAIGHINCEQKREINHLCKSNKLFVCRECSATQCTQCVYLNKKYTGEYCVPPEIQCLKSNIEREISLKLFKDLIDADFPIYNIPNYSHMIDVKLDPIAAERPKQKINKYDIKRLQKTLEQYD